MRFPGTLAFSLQSNHFPAFPESAEAQGTNYSELLQDDKS